MSQFNLLPDIKLQYLKAERTRRLVISFSVLLSVLVIVLTVVILSLTILQKHQISNLDKDIKAKGASLSSETNLGEILTIQNQIQTLSSLHQQEPEATNLESYLYQIIPTAANISTLNVDFNANNINITGNADTFATVNQLADSLKFATYTVKGSSENKAAFSSVVLSDFSVGSSGGIDYTIQFNFDPTIFNNTDAITLSVPSKVSTRSQLDQPTTLFVTKSNGG